MGMGASFKTNSHVRTIWLHENRIGNVGAQYLVDALRENHTIEQVCLIQNNITDRRIEGEIEKILGDATGREKRAADQQSLPAAAVAEEKQNEIVSVSNDGGGSSDVMKDAEIAELKNILQNQINHKDAEIAGLKAVLERPPRAPSPASSPNVKMLCKKENVDPVNTISTSAEATVFEDDARDDNPAVTLHLVSSTE